MMTYALVIVLIRSLVEAFKKFIVLPEQGLKILVFVLSGIFVWAYRLNVMAEVGIPSAYLIFDYAVSVVAISVAAMLGHDLFDILARKK